ncbi:MAG: hypothetical protein FWE11_07975 [Defluviitaleaceae bacterium]|nr:hypothetical protein [Defluviitaleaceae bacterium]
MKKMRFFIVILSLVFVFSLMSGCSGPDDVEEITDRFFVRQVENILMNLDSFTGRTIRMEGMFFSWNDGANEYYFVLRHLDDCCGGGGSVGFEIYLGDGFEPFDDDTWVTITGVLDVKDGWQANNPVLVITSIRQTARGQEFVTV